MKFVHALIGIAAVAALSGCARGCAKTQDRMAEEMVEKAIEQAAKSSGEELEGLDIKIADGEVKVKTSEGSFQLGENLTLPENFPSAVPIYEGAEVVQFSHAEQGASIVLRSKDSRADVVSFYKTALGGGGWTTKATAELPSGHMLQYALGSTNLSLFVADNEGETMITLALVNQ